MAPLGHLAQWWRALRMSQSICSCWWRVLRLQRGDAPALDAEAALLVLGVGEQQHAQLVVVGGCRQHDEAQALRRMIDAADSVAEQTVEPWMSPVFAGF
jgi:hypothetical protein